MCLAVPRRVLERGTDGVLVDVDGRSIWVRTTGVVDVKPDEYVLVYAGHALQQISVDEAEELLAFYSNLEAANA